MHRFGPIGAALDRARLYLLLAALGILLAVLCGCAASASWTIARGEAGTCGTHAAGDHWSPAVVESVGGAAGETVKRIVRP